MDPLRRNQSQGWGGAPQSPPPTQPSASLPGSPPANSPGVGPTAYSATPPPAQPYGQGQAGQAQGQGASQGFAPRELPTKDLVGRSVIDNRGTSLGEVADIEIDPGSWRVSGLLIDLDKRVADNLHLGKRAFHPSRLTVSTDRVQAVGDAVILNVTAGDIASLLYQNQGQNLP